MRPLSKAGVMASIRSINHVRRGLEGPGGAARAQGRKSHYLRLLPTPPAASPRPQSLPLSADLDRQRRHLHSIRAAERVCVHVCVNICVLKCVCVYLSYLCHVIQDSILPSFNFK